MYGEPRSRFITRLLVGVCLLVWLVVGLQIRFVFAAGESKIVNTLGGQRITWVLHSSDPVGATAPPTPGGGVWYGMHANDGWGAVQTYSSGLTAMYVCYSGGPKYYQKYRYYKSVSTNIVDTDNDGLEDSWDPCPSSYDSKFNVYRVANRCDGSYFWFQTAGECGTYKNHYNPKYASMKDAIDDSRKKSSCNDVSTASLTATQLNDFWSQSLGVVNGTAGTAPDNSTEPSPNVTGASGVSSGNYTAPTTDDAPTQAVIDSIEAFKKEMSSNLNSNSAKEIAQGISNTDRIISALASDRAAANNINNGVDALRNAASAAASQAHNDAQALKTAIENIKPSNATASSSGGITGEDLDSSFTKDRDATWGTANNNLQTDTGSAASGFANALGVWSDTVSSKFSTLMPALSIQTISPSPCLDAGYISDSSGHNYSVQGICLDKYSAQFEMVGNLLFAFVGITCVLNLFRLRG